MKLEIRGLDEAKKQLQQLRNRAQELDGTHSVPIEELLTPRFNRRHTRGCTTATEWFEGSGLKIESQEDFAAIPDGTWDAYVRSSTSFRTWQSMLEAAGAEMIKRRLFE